MEKENKLKILQVISTPPFAWATGGCARISFDFSKELVKRGNSVTILTTDMLKPQERCKNKDEIIEGVRILRFRNISDRLAWNYKFYFSTGIIKYLKNNVSNYDIVHLQDLISIQAFFTMKYCKKNKIPYIITPHGSLKWILDRKLINKIYYRLFGKKILNNSCKITAFTKFESEQVKELGLPKNKTKIIPNGLDLDCYLNLPENGLFREKYSIDKNDSIILYLGRIHESKGIQLLLLAFKKLNKEIPKSKLVIVGPDDGFLSEVKKLVSFHEIESNVIFTGPLYEKEKISAYVDADLHVLPRSWEPFGLTLIESCACGTPVICIEGCGISDFVKKSGYVVKYDENEIKTAMVKLLNNKNLIQRIKSEGKLLVNQHYNLSIIVEKLEKIYIDCLE